jgi:CzcA family heavy metal efflux pump
MLKAIVQFSLRFRGVVIALSLLLLAYSLYSLKRASYDVFPEFAPPQVDIQTEAPGLSPEQVEVLVTQPIENAVNGVPGIESLRSSSIQGLSVVTAIFRPGRNIYEDRQAIAERLTSVTALLPQGVEPPVMTPLTSSTGDLMSIGLTSGRLSLMDLRTIADWTLKPRLLSVPGVSKVGVFGGEIRQIQIQIRPERLVRFNLSLQDVLAAARRATGVRGGGFLDTGDRRIVLQVEGQSLSPEEISKIVLASPGSSFPVNLTLGDVAKVVEAPEPPISGASVMNRPGVVLNLWGQYGANTLETTRKLEAALAALRPVLESQGVVLHPDLFRAANFIETALGNVRSSLLIGAALVVVILFLFLFNLRTAAISCTAIPLSLLAAVAVLRYLGLSLNTMTLGGLAIAIGEVVDDAVIDLENILRRLRENRRSANPKATLHVVQDASLEVRGAVVYATFAVMLVFVPILTLPGLAGRFFAPLGAAYILAIFASLVVALTVTPALCLTFIRHQELENRESPLVVWLKEKYHRLLLGTERHFRAVAVGVAVFTVAGLVLTFFFGGEFFPEFEEGHFIAHMTAAPGTSIEESLRLGQRVTEALRKLPFVRSVAQRVGRAAVDDVFGTNASEIEIDLKPLGGAIDAEEAQEAIRSALPLFPGVTFEINSFLTERIEETVSGENAAVAVYVYGSDLDLLDGKAREIAAILQKVRGATDVRIQAPPGTPQLAIRPRKVDLVSWGFEPIDFLEDVRTAYQGDIVGQFYEGNSVFDLSVILDPEERRVPSKVGDLLLRNPTGTYVRLKQLADVEEVSGRYAVLHRGALRVQAVTCNVAGRDVASFTAEAKQKILSGVSFSGGTYPEFAGTEEEGARSERDLLIHSLFAGVGILLLLWIVTGSARNLFLILLNLPLALVGGVLAVFASGATMSLGSLVGFVTLFGITLRNSLMMISHYEHLVAVEGAAWSRETAFRGAAERLAPILMTALVTALGLLPLAIGTGSPGREIEGPMALVILGGLVTSTFLNLLILPMLALRYGRFERNPQGPVS